MTKPLPHNLQAEHAVLGAILYDNDARERIGDLLAPDHFYEPFHQRVFAAMDELLRKGRLAEPLALVERFKTDPGFAELGGMPFLANLIEQAPPASAAPHFARIVRDLAVRRGLARLGSELAEAATGDAETTASEMLEQAEGTLYALAEQGPGSSGPKRFDDVLTRAVEAAATAYGRDGKLSGHSTGLMDLDRLLGGLHRSDLVIVAGRPGQGKSALAGNIASHLALSYAWEKDEAGNRKTTAGGIVLLFSLEMSDEQFGLRILADVAEVSGDRIRKGQIKSEEFARIRDAALEIQGSPLFIDDTGAISLAQLCARARRQKRTTGLDLVIVDYLQLVTTSNRKGEGRVQEVSEITQGLKALAKELDVPVLALSQLSRKVEDRPDKKPQLSDLRESGSIEQDADVVMFVYREAYYLKQAEPRRGTDEHLAWQDKLDKVANAAEVIIGKQRHGPVGTVHLHFNEDLTKFSNAARDDFALKGGEGARQTIYSGVADA